MQQKKARQNVILPHSFYITDDLGDKDQRENQQSGSPQTAGLMTADLTVSDLAHSEQHE